MQLAPSLLQELKAGRALGADATRIEAISALVGALPVNSPVIEDGVWDVPSSSAPGKSYRVSFGRAGHLQCTCPGFEYRGECRHVRDIRKTAQVGASAQHGALLT
jgi:hypothetical protein